MVDPSRTRVLGPLAPFAPGFARELLRQGYTPKSACMQMWLMAHVSRWLTAEGISACDLRAHEVERFLTARRAAGYTCHRTERALKPLLGYLRELGVAPPLTPSSPLAGPLEETLERYRRYLAIERGFKSSTVDGYVSLSRPFLSERLSTDGLALELEDLSAADVTAFVVEHCRQRSRGAAKVTVSALRSLLRFLHLDGVIERPLVSAVPAVAGWRLAGLPRALEPAQVLSLLASCDRRTNTGRRDFAILTILVRLGLRAGEVAALQLDDVDWRAGDVVIRGKGDRVERLPLPADVGEALVGYLRRGRPRSAEGRSVFVRVRAPHRSLSTNGISQVVEAAARRSGLGKIRAHRLRHTAATLMLRSGATLPEISQLLRHHSVGTTAIYAKVDREALRTIARPWPGGVE